MTTSEMLPSNATVLEESLAIAGSALSAIPTPIDLIKRPYETPLSFLPFLAAEMSVDVWDAEWPEARKRAVTARSLPLHKIKGTIACIREYVRYADGVVLRVERPGQKVFSGPSLTRDERERWLSALPQVRVWRTCVRGTVPNWKAFHGGRSRSHFAELSFMMPSTARQRLRRLARYVVDGVETDVRVTEFGSYFRLHLRASSVLGVFSNVLRGRSFFMPSTARSRLVTIQPTPRLAYRFPVGPTLAPVASEPERVRVRATRAPGVGAFSGVISARSFFVPSTAHFRLFDRYAIYDGRRVSRRPPMQFMNIGRYSFPAHTLRIRISIPIKRHAAAAGEGFALPGTHFWFPHDGRPLRRVMRAIIAAQRGSDRILLIIGPRRRFVAGYPFIAGESRFIAA